MNQASTSYSFFKHPVWLVGFRPFFILTIISGAVLPLAWLLVLPGYFTLREGLSPYQWHAHEMLFGFGWAVLGGFLLTATKNWVNIRGYHGAILFVLAVLWLADRLAFLLPSGFPGVLLFVLHNAFLLLILAMLLWTLVAHRKNDSYPENWLFIISLPFFLAGKNMLLSQEYYNLGWSMTLGLFRLAFVIMLERTLTQFMKAAFQVNILRNKKLDFSIKLGTLAAVFASVMPVPLAIAVLAVTATLLLIRFFFWSPLKALTRLDNGVMHVGYLALVVSLYLECLQLAGMQGAVGNVAAHTFTLLCLGPIIPAMLVRIVQGHTGRKIIFTTSDKIAIWACGLGGFIRLAPPQIWPSSYQVCIVLSALGWVICYALIGWRLVPFMLKPRIDGKEH